MSTLESSESVDLVGRPRVGSIADRAISTLRSRGKIRIDQLAAAIDCEISQVETSLQMWIRRGMLVQVRSRGVLFFDLSEQERIMPFGERLAPHPDVVASAAPAESEQPKASDVIPTIAALTAESVEASREPVVKPRPALADLPPSTRLFGEVPSEQTAPRVEFIPTIPAARLPVDVSELEDTSCVARVGSAPPYRVPELDDEPQPFNCALYMDGRFVIIHNRTTLVLSKNELDDLRDYLARFVQ